MLSDALLFASFRSFGWAPAPVRSMMCSCTPVEHSNPKRLKVCYPVFTIATIIRLPPLLFVLVQIRKQTETRKHQEKNTSATVKIHRDQIPSHNRSQVETCSI